MSSSKSSIIKNYDVVCGIDYSLTCPAITIFKGTTFTYSFCKTHYLTSTKKYQGKFLDGRIEGHIYSPEMFVNSPMARYNFLADWTYSIVSGVDHGSIEGYSFGSKGKVFHIAENTGVMKYFLWYNGIYDKFIDIPPTTMKKYATGKGNAKKEDVYAEFVKTTGTDLRTELDYESEKIDSPISDIADSYFLCKMAFDSYQVQKKLLQGKKG